jgi:hypothetical protein
LLIDFAGSAHHGREAGVEQLRDNRKTGEGKSRLSFDRNGLNAGGKNALNNSIKRKDDFYKAI